MKKIKRLMGLLLAAVMTMVMFGQGAVLADQGEEELDGSTPSGITYSELGDKIAEYIEARESGTASVSLAVIDNQETINKTYYGFSDIDSGLKADGNTVYEWGSVSKLLVWTSVMQLYEQGRLDLAEDIREYLPAGFLTKLSYAAPVTMTDLMNHTAGWQETVYDVETSDSSKIISLADALKQSEPAQIYAPGTVCAYSNWGASLAAYIVECITGEDFCDYVHENIFAPLQMEHTSLAPDCSDNAWVAGQRQLLNCYSIYDGSYEDLGPSIRYILLYPSGAATGTLEDFLTFAKALVPQKQEPSPLFEKNGTQDTMISATSYYGDSGMERNCHGLWTLQYGVNVMGHSGNTSGCSSMLMFDPVSGTGIVIMTNECGETAYNYGLLSFLFGSYEPENAAITQSPDISGMYTSMRSYEKGFPKLYKFIGSILPLSKTEDEAVYKLAVGQGTLTQVADHQYIMDNKNGFQYLMYLDKRVDGTQVFEMMSQDIEKENTAAYSIRLLSFVLLAVSVIHAAIMLPAALICTVIKKLRKKSHEDSGSHLWKAGRFAVLAAILLGGVLFYFIILLPLNGGSVIKSDYAWKCILLGIVSLIPTGNLFMMIVSAKNQKGTKRQKMKYIVTAVMGMILSMNIWYWQMYNFWVC